MMETPNHLRRDIIAEATHILTRGTLPKMSTQAFQTQITSSSTSSVTSKLLLTYESRYFHYIQTCEQLVPYLAWIYRIIYDQTNGVHIEKG